MIKFDKPATVDPSPTFSDLDGAQLGASFGNPMVTIYVNGPKGVERIQVDGSALNLDAFILAALGVKYQVVATKFDPPPPVVEVTPPADPLNPKP